MGYPQLRMYYTNGTRVLLVSNNMARYVFPFHHTSVNVRQCSTYRCQIVSHSFLLRGVAEAQYILVKLDQAFENLGVAGLGTGKLFKRLGKRVRTTIC